MTTVDVYKIRKGNKYFYARIDMDMGSYCIGYQCYKETGEFIYSKWSSLKTLKFRKNEIVEEFKKEVIE